MTVGRAATTRFALVGDFGMNNANELEVANLIKTNFQPEFIVTVGDNNYLGPTKIDDAIGKYYHSFIGNYTGTYGAGASSNRFFPALGNHDRDGGDYAAHTNYFTLPDNERYYDFVRGPVHFFILNTDPEEPNGTTVSSIQGRWFSNRIASSTAPWRIVMAHDPPYSSSESHPSMRWPFEEWGASLVVSGDAHHYERVMRDGFPYVVNGAGGASLAGFGTPIAGSVVRYNTDHGAMLVRATATDMSCEFWSAADGGTRIDQFTLTKLRLSVAHSNSVMRVNWLTNDADGSVLESASTTTNNWTVVPQAPVLSGNRNVVTLSPTGQARYFRLRQ